MVGFNGWVQKQILNHLLSAWRIFYIFGLLIVVSFFAVGLYDSEINMITVP